MEKGLLFVVSAPAGCGKDTILEQLFKVTDNVGYSVSATSRATRRARGTEFTITSAPVSNSSR